MQTLIKTFVLSLVAPLELALRVNVQPMCPETHMSDACKCRRNVQPDHAVCMSWRHLPSVRTMRYNAASASKQDTHQICLESNTHTKSVHPQPPPPQRLVAARHTRQSFHCKGSQASNMPSHPGNELNKKNRNNNNNSSSSSSNNNKKRTHLLRVKVTTVTFQ